MADARDRFCGSCGAPYASSGGVDPVAPTQLAVDGGPTPARRLAKAKGPIPKTRVGSLDEVEPPKPAPAPAPASARRRGPVEMPRVAAPTPPRQSVWEMQDDEPLPDVPGLPRRRRRGRGLAPKILLVALLGVVAGVATLWVVSPARFWWVASRLGLQPDLSRVDVVLPATPTPVEPVIVPADVPRLPDGVVALDPAWEISMPDGAPAPEAALVRLALPDPSIADRDDVAVHVAHVTDGGLELLPTQLEGGWAIARTKGFSRFFLATVDRRAPSPGESVSGYRVGRPYVWGLRIAGDEAFAVLDVSGCRTAYPEQWWRGGLAVRSLRVYVSRPDRELPASSAMIGMPRPTPAAFAPYRVDDADVVVPVTWGAQEVRLDLPLDGPMHVDGNTIPVTGYPWLLRVAPVFADGREGAQSDFAYVYAGVAEAHLRQRLGLAERLGGGEAFLEATRAHPYYVIFESWIAGEAYASNLTANERFWAAVFWRVSGHGLIGMRAQGSEMGRVVTHEWGHYATHVMLGDQRFAQIPAGAHAGWKPAESRRLAWSEDLATLLGQFSTGHGLPDGAGAMVGRWFDYSRRPEGNEVASLWPNTRDMDAARVEGVPATIVSRFALEPSVGFARVYAAIAERFPRDVIEFFQLWEGEPAGELQAIYLDEGVAWRVRARVMGEREEGAPREPLAGALVRVTSPEGKVLGPEVATSDADGWVELSVPPGQVRFDVRAQGHRPKRVVTFAIDAEQPTNAEPTSVEEELVMIPSEPPEVTIASPRGGDRVRERVLTVTGTVAGTTTGTPDGEPIDRVQLFVNGESYDVPVADGRFSQAVVVSRGEVTLRAVARNDAGEGEARVSLEADVDATYLRVVLTWQGRGTDVDLWITDPEGVTTGWRSREPAEGRRLDLDDTDGLGPETYTVTRLLPGTYEVRVNYFRGAGPEYFHVRWFAHEGTEHETRGEETGALRDADGNGRTPAANHRFTIDLPALEP